MIHRHQNFCAETQVTSDTSFVYSMQDLTLSTLLQVLNENVVVRDFRGKEIQSQLIPLLNISLSLRKYHAMAYLGKSPRVSPRYWLAFSATVPPLGFSTYIVSSAKGAG